MNRKLIPLALAAMVAAPAAHAGFSANVGLTSNYLWRGVTQSDDGFAVSGGIDYEHDSGFYVGTWASNINWAVYGNPNDGVEIDFYGGFAGEANGVGYDVGIIYYHYPDNMYDGSDFTELYGSLSYGPFEAGLAYTIDADWANHDNIYYYVSAGTDIAEGWNLSGTIGHFDFDSTCMNCDYNHAQLDLTKSLDTYGDLTFTVSVAGKNSGDDDAKAVVSWTKSF